MGPDVAGANPNPPLTSPGEVWGYYQGDHFQFGNYDDDVHLLLGFSGAMVIGLTLEHKFGMKRWQAALIGTLALGLFGTAKEVLHDNYTSKTDIKTWWGGALAGGMTMTLLQF